MEDLISFMETPQPKELPEYTVSEISFEIKRFVETKFSKVRIRGEIFGAKRADSGHWYLSLKDENAVLSAVIWKGVAAHLNFRPEDGLEVIAAGKITTFTGKSNYQLVIEQMEIAGTGALLKLLEERRKKFAEEGLFDPAHKKPIPYLPQTIGVVTSASGAVIRDIIHRIRDRFPTPILLWPTPVQGEGAAEKIASAIAGFNSLPENGIPRPDVLIVARGGGSLEDLWPFNEEVVIRAVYDSHIPVISAVGHEIDISLTDFAADLRASTPTAASELVTPDWNEVMEDLDSYEYTLDSLLRNKLASLKEKLSSLAERPFFKSPLGAFEVYDEKIARLADRLSASLARKLERCASRLSFLEGKLTALDARKTLERGFAYLTDGEGRSIVKATEAKVGTRIVSHLTDGYIVSEVQEVSEHGKEKA